MAISITISERTVMGNKRVHRGTGNLGTYVADGVPITAADVGLRRLDHLSVSASYDAANDIGTPIGYDATNSKITALYDNGVAAAAGLADASTDDLSGQIFSWEAWGV
jgi:hypothetical protein